jgi:hypothetical protein
VYPLKDRQENGSRLSLGGSLGFASE